VSGESNLLLEHFIQAVQSQLDNAQTAMAHKAKNLDLQLTFAIKDISMDLRAHVEIAQSQIYIRPAGPGDTEASVFHLVFTGITRPMIEENAVAFTESPDDRSIDELEDDLTEDERRRLEWAGVRTISKLREEIEIKGTGRTVGRLTNLPVDRLRRALERASKPLVEHVLPVQRPLDESDDVPNLLRIRGKNLMKKSMPRVLIGGKPVSVVHASENELVVAPEKDQMAGELSVEPSPNLVAAMAFDLSPYWQEQEVGAKSKQDHAEDARQ